jgi:CRP/FNR family transcriptional regulator, nitrogen oxide reductase regulator
MASTAVELLRETPVFRELSDEDRHLFAGIGQTRLYPKGELIFAEGDRAEHLYTVARGKVKVFKVTPSGKEIILAILGPGTPVGAVAVYESVPFPASAMAFEDCVLIRIPSRAYFELLEKHPDLVRRLLGAMTHRLMEFNHRFPELAGGSVESRFARLFLRLADEIGRRQEGGVLVPLRLSRQELSDFTGTTIETSIRIMSRWGKDGLVETRDDGFLVKDFGALETLSSS